MVTVWEKAWSGTTALKKNRVKERGGYGVNGVVAA